MSSCPGFTLHDTNLCITYFSACGKIDKKATTKKIGKNLQLKIDSGWRVEAGPTRKYVLMKKPQPDPIQPEFGPWGLNSTRLNPFFHPKNGFNPKNRVGFGRTILESSFDNLKSFIAKSARNVCFYAISSFAAGKPKKQCSDHFDQVIKCRDKSWTEYYLSLIHI